MKTFAIFSFFVCAALLSGCAKSSDSSSSKAKSTSTSILPPAQNAIGEYGYKFDAKNENGQPCTTGVQNFDSLAQMCINIQDPVQNGGDCAWRERMKKFSADCEPRGFSFYESRECKVVLLNKKSEVSAFRDFNKKDVVQNANYCVGRTRSGMILGGLHLYGYFHDDILSSVDMNFATKDEQSRGRQISFELKMYRNPTTGDKPEAVIEDFQYNNGTKTHSGLTRDGKYKYLIRCNHTWACGAKNSEE